MFSFYTPSAPQRSPLQAKALPAKSALAKPGQKLAAIAKPLIAGLVGGIIVALQHSPKVFAQPATLVAQTYPLLSSGSTGSAVSQLQATLKLLGFYTGDVNGSYTVDTQNAVIQFQSAAGIDADGVAGPSTWEKLLPSPNAVASIPASQLPTQPPPAPIAQTPDPEIPDGPPILRPGITGPAVSQLQRELTTLGYYQGEIDGGYGDVTQEAVRIFQADRGLTVDAIVGPSTWDALTQALSE